ncbi:hypothetical protein NDU88_000674 [Pleurodeles waltl]|uniref:Endonuclease/exonuclease/phosphatase domain-containing protein n=1 Tax=Pleurodeles waltl TaxID=8319 RepID=A0AAV7UQN4_PLEWA|nr:hypothetical protein NDU88_000674 [Pleurodeles waltl]
MQHLPLRLRSRMFCSAEQFAQALPEIVAEWSLQKGKFTLLGDLNLHFKDDRDVTQQLAALQLKKVIKALKHC